MRDVPTDFLSLVLERSYEAHGRCGNGLNGGLSRHYDELDATSVVDAGLESAYLQRVRQAELNSLMLFRV